MSDWILPFLVLLVTIERKSFHDKFVYATERQFSFATKVPSYSLYWLCIRPRVLTTLDISYAVFWKQSSLIRLKPKLNFGNPSTLAERKCTGHFSLEKVWVALLFILQTLMHVIFGHFFQCLGVWLTDRWLHHLLIRLFPKAPLKVFTFKLSSRITLRAQPLQDLGFIKSEAKQRFELSKSLFSNRKKLAYLNYAVLDCVTLTLLWLTIVTPLKIKRKLTGKY